MAESRFSCKRFVRGAIVFVAFACAAGCGGGGGGSSAAPSPGNPPGAPSGGWTPGVFAPSATFAAQCRAPRPGTNDLPGSTLIENNWLRSWSHELSLWYDEIEDRNPALYPTPTYFDLLKTFAFVDGKPKDRFHYMVPTDEWNAFSQSGVSAGYGVQWLIVNGEPPRRVVAAYIHPGSPAEAAGIERGAEVLKVDGVDLVVAATDAEVEVLNAGLFPGDEGETHRFVIRDRGAAEPREILLTSEDVT